MQKFRVSLLSLALVLAVPFAPQALAKTSAAVAASQPDIASGSAMIDSRVIPHLIVKGAADAIDFYGRAFGAVEQMRLDGRCTAV